jgi:hypothetical protein
MFSILTSLRMREPWPAAAAALIALALQACGWKRVYRPGGADADRHHVG